MEREYKYGPCLHGLHPLITHDCQYKNVGTYIKSDRETGMHNNSLLTHTGGKSVRLWCDGSSDRSVMVDPFSYLSFQLMLHDWCNKGRGMCYPVCGI